ncbi:MAG: bifunctional riboflavin kinase/FAD synthetase [Mariprofundaceae bacterium]
MQILRSWHDAKASITAQQGAITIGNFDGVHMGHQQVLSELKGHALSVGGPAIAVTFDPHPRAVLYPDEAPRRLCHLHERLTYLEDAGVDAVLLLEFNKELAACSADTFSRRLHQTFSFKHMHVGYDFAFGHDREGHVSNLRILGDDLDFTVSEAAAFEMKAAVVSSSRIRSLVEAADFEMVQKLLGRGYTITGEVLHGEKRGREMNFPTANIDIADLVHPAIGIYAIRANNSDKHWDGAAYLGYRPTFNGRTLLLEAHLFDDSPNLYGTALTIQFVQRIREDRAFISHKDLGKQIASDCDEARVILRSSAESHLCG